MTVAMKEKRSREMVWSTVKLIVSNGQVVGLQDRMTCRIFSVDREEKCVRNIREGES